MKNLRKILTLYIFICFCFVLCSCTGCTNVFRLQSIGKDEISIVSYNAQTFFDAVEDGREFKEFKGSKTKWSKAKYAERLLRLKEAVNLSCLALGLGEKDIPDILVLQEIESHAVIDDFCKILPMNNSYKYAVFIPPQKGGAFSTALLSKFPIIETKVFNIYSGKRSLRPMIETRIQIGNSTGDNELVLLNVHWKSKVGKSDTDSIRRQQEEQAYKRLKRRNLKLHLLYAETLISRWRNFLFYPNSTTAGISKPIRPLLKKEVNPQEVIFIEENGKESIIFSIRII